MLACYIWVVRQMRGTKMISTGTSLPSTFTHSISQNSGKTQRKKTRCIIRTNEVHTIAMCVATVFSFMVCWVPFHAIHLAKLREIVNKTVSERPKN